MASYLITGSARGIGLALATMLASKPASEVGKIFASSRSENDALKKLVAESSGRVEFVQLDVINEETVKTAATKVSESLGGKGLDVLINNAGTLNITKGGIENMTDLDDILKINVTSVHSVTRAFLPLLKKGSLKKVVNISSTLGSIGMAPIFKGYSCYAYSISKAALNMLTVQYAQGLEAEGFTVISLSPGWVKTDLGTSAADLTPEQSAKATLDIVFRVNTAETGKFFNVHVPGYENAPGVNQYDGACPPW